jgi:membrane protease YdiL (CAAX protease family)
MRPGPFIYLVSIIALILSGYFLAKYLNGRPDAWIWVALYYGVWMLATILIVLRKTDFRQVFRRAAFHYSLVVPLLFASIALIGIFIPNIQLHRINQLLLMNGIICLFNPFIEELYWRVLPSKMVSNKVIEYLIASLTFAVGHPLILGVNSTGASGWPTLAGAFVLGSCWWIYYNQRKSIAWPVLTHFLIDLFGMSAYLLANQVPLLM